MRPTLTYMLEKAARGDARVHEHEHLRTHLLQQTVSPMHFGNIVAVDFQPDHPMAATFGQEHTAHLRIGAWAVLIAAAPKGGRVGLGIGGVKDGAINGHEPIATKEGAGHAGWLGDQLTALAHERLQTVAAQPLAPSTYA